MEFIRKNKKSILEILFLVLLVAFTFYALLKDQELEEIFIYSLQSLDENFLKNISALSLTWKMQHLQQWNLPSVSYCFLLQENISRF